MINYAWFCITKGSLGGFFWRALIRNNSVQEAHGPLYGEDHAARPAQAIAELIWSSLDADASYVSASFGHNALGRVDSIQLRDNGTGIPYDKALSARGMNWLIS